MIRSILCLCVLGLLGLPVQADEPIRLAPGSQPQVAVDPAGNVAVAFARGQELWVAASSDGGQSFAAPVRVETVAGMPVGMRRGPRIAATKDALVVSAISAAQGGGKDGDLYAWRSTDLGKTWSKIVQPLNSVAGAAREGLHGMTAGPEGTLACVWLDLRHARPGQGGTEVWCAVSTDGGQTWSQDRVVYRNPAGSVCECCHPSIAIDDHGRISVMFRNSLQGARDMYLAVSQDQGKSFAEPAKLGTGTWRLNGCPMDGGGLAVYGQQITTIWRRESEVFAVTPGQPERSLGKGRQPALALAAEGMYALWTDGPALMHQVPGASAPALLAKSAAYPAIAAATTGNGPVVAVWEQDGQVLVSRLATGKQ